MQRHHKLIKAGIITAIIAMLVVTVFWKLWGGRWQGASQASYATKTVCEGSNPGGCQQTN